MHLIWLSYLFLIFSHLLYLFKKSMMELFVGETLLLIRVPKVIILFLVPCPKAGHRSSHLARRDREMWDLENMHNPVAKCRSTCLHITNGMHIILSMSNKSMFIIQEMSRPVQASFSVSTGAGWESVMTLWDLNNWYKLQTTNRKNLNWPYSQILLLLSSCFSLVLNL